MTRAEVESLFNGFIAQWDGKSCEMEDPSALDQCMDLAFAWVDALGIPRDTIRHGYAYQVWATPNPDTTTYFDLIPNTPDVIPLKGDLAIFGTVNGIPVGHISIETGKSDVNNLITFDQNWDTLHYYHLDEQGNHIPYCRTVVHANYYDCVGFLRPKTTEPVEQPTPEVVVTPTEIPVTATTDTSNVTYQVPVTNTTTSPITGISSTAGESATIIDTQENPTPVVQTTTLPQPKKPSFTLGQLIDFYLMRIKNTLIFLWKKILA